MIYHNKYITELFVDGAWWSGPNIDAKSFKEAEEYINKNGMGYLRVCGKLGFSFDTNELN